MFECPMRPATLMPAALGPAPPMRVARAESEGLLCNMPKGDLPEPGTSLMISKPGSSFCLVRNKPAALAPVIT